MKTLFTLLFLLYGLLVLSQDTINDYYEEITTGTEFNSNTGKIKFYKDVKIYVFGEKNDTLMNELNNIVYELNELIESINIVIVNDSSISNLDIYIGSSDYFCSVRREKYIHDLSKVAQGFFVTYPYKGSINSGLVFVNTQIIKSIVRKKHVLREELTQCLGFGNDSYRYNNSIFYESFSEVTSFSEIDKLIIYKHYSLNN